MVDFFWILILATLIFIVFNFIWHRYLGKVVKHKALAKDYVVGLNYLLEDQEDKALDLFINLLIVDQDTVETHLALGSLFRKKGEVDRAIRIARPLLTTSERNNALLALGKDYLMAGVLDRAERIFLDLVNVQIQYSKSALECLLEIYQREKAWGKAIQIAKKLQTVNRTSMVHIIAHHYCELAET